MSYCRFDGKNSDVYVVSTHHPEDKFDVWWCCGCNRPGNLAKSRSAILEHLIKHREDGDKVPAEALERLEREIRAEMGPSVQLP